MRRIESRPAPTLSPAQRELTRRSREMLVRGGLLTQPPGRSGVPQHIEKSWRRCVGEQVPVAPDHIDYREPDEAVSVLRRAAMPVLDRLKDSFADVPVAMVLSDATGLIVARHVDVRRQRDVMDRASAAEGFDFSEHSIGTNGIGTVLAERRPVLVRGPEHYNALKNSKTIVLKNEDHDVFGDGTVVLKTTPGHTPGHQVLFVKLAKTGPVLLAGDLYHYPEERTFKRFPTFEFNVEQSAASRAKMDDFMKQTGARMWIEHDKPTHAKLKKAPEYYD